MYKEMCDLGLNFNWCYKVCKDLPVVIWSLSLQCWSLGKVVLTIHLLFYLFIFNFFPGRGGGGGGGGHDKFILNWLCRGLCSMSTV